MCDRSHTPQVRATVPLPVHASDLLPGMAFSPSRQIPERVLRLGRSVAISGKASLIFRAELSQERHLAHCIIIPRISDSPHLGVRPCSAASSGQEAGSSPRHLYPFLFLPTVCLRELIGPVGLDHCFFIKPQVYRHRAVFPIKL